jgi:PAS domain S-box-containing protein
MSEARYRAVTASVSDAVVTADSAGRIVDWNRSAERIFGYAEAEVIGQALTLLMPQRFRQRHIDGLQLAQSSGELRAAGRIVEMVGRRSDGSEFPIEISLAQWHSEGNVYFTGFIRDTTERKRIEEDLKKSVAFRDLLLEAMPLPVFHKDTAGRYTGGNSAFARFIGKPMREIIGKTVFEVSPRELAQTYRDRDLDLLDDASGMQTYESRVAHADGTEHDVIFHKVRMVDEVGRPTGILGVITDISERKRLEALHAQAQKLESLGTLAGGIAHDFNNILAAIQGNADLAAEDVGPDHPAAESLVEIRKAGVRAHELVRRIMAFARAKEAQRKTVDLGAVVSEVLQLLRSTLPAGISLKTAFAADAPLALADAGQVHETIVNLTTNAAYAIGRRAGWIEYRLESVQAGEKHASSIPGLKQGHYARLTVADSGCGMDAATLERVFDAFYTTKPASEGTGLGLSMVHGIMRNHGGAVTVESAPGKGARFALYFPAAAQVAGDEAGAADTQSPPAAGRRVLYVDDEEMLVTLAERVLSRLGHEISAYTDPERALQAFRSNPQNFDVVVTDLSMPHMDGLELAREVMALRPGMPVLLTTGYVRPEDEARARAYGVRELILKPVTTDELGKVLDRLFRTSRARG